MTAKKKIENQLRQQGHVSNYWCIDERITTRLGAVIHKLKQQGWKIDTKEKYNGTKDTRYYLVRDNHKCFRLPPEINCKTCGEQMVEQREQVKLI